MLVEEFANALPCKVASDVGTQALNARYCKRLVDAHISGHAAGNNAAVAVERVAAPTSAFAASKVGIKDPTIEAARALNARGCQLRSALGATRECPQAGLQTFHSNTVPVPIKWHI